MMIDFDHYDDYDDDDEYDNPPVVEPPSEGDALLAQRLAVALDGLGDLVKELQDVEADLERAYLDGTLDEDLYDRLRDIIDKAYRLSS